VTNREAGGAGGKNDTGRAEVPQGVGDDSYRVLFDSALIGLGVADMEGNLIAFNDAMLEPGGYTREDIQRLGTVARLYADPADRDRVLARVRAQGFVWREEVQFLRKDGTPYDTLLSLTPVRFGGRPCLYATVEDVTVHKQSERERRELETKLLRAQKMEAVGQMTAGIAHDFNNILAVVLTSCEMAEHALPPEAEASRQHLAEAREGMRRGATMIRKLLGFSRTAPLEIAPTDLASVLDGMRGMLESLVPDEITLELSAGTGGVALCDAGAVEQIVINLATNACDAMPAGGILRVTVDAVSGSQIANRPPWLPDRAYVRLVVADTGFGMDEVTLAHALEPFFTTKMPGEGTGLGLSMVFGLAKQQGGYVDLSSELGRGTTARVYLPQA
jgi:two-component system cell cycle sensor histidine kinase/response regulator CckA